jgi:hypothetical protein
MRLQGSRMGSKCATLIASERLHGRASIDRLGGLRRPPGRRGGWENRGTVMREPNDYVDFSSPHPPEPENPD